MILPAPIAYAVSLVSWYHLLIWLCLPGLIGLSNGEKGWSVVPFRFAVGAIGAVLAYLLIMPVVGQLFGQKFPFSQIWPAAIVLGLLISAAFMGFIAISDTAKRATETLIAFAIFSVFLGGVLTFLLYAFPRWVASGSFVDLPKANWGVVV